MEKKKVTKATAKDEVVKTASKKEGKKPSKVTKAKVNAEPVVVEVANAKVEVQKAEVVKPEHAKAKVTLNQELNLVIGLLSIFTIICFCFAFQGGNAEVLGWELILKGETYSGVFKTIMVMYLISLVVDCLLTVRIDTENEIFNIVEKVLYICTAVLNVIVLAILLTLISSFGIGLIIFMIVSFLSILTKLVRVYAKK
ncbi:MAG: hypothetical protein IJA72_05120 [Clostridia bacterium]|nr:hypothetical protein [Clostridia bacterium]